jgi:hypothetical protein
MIFPKVAFDTAFNSPLAASAVAALIYVGAVGDPDLGEENRYARPTTILWLNEDVLAHHTDELKRDAWYKAAVSSGAKDKARSLLESWGVSTPQWYGENTRETLRDETLPAWRDNGAAFMRPGLPTASPAPRWALKLSFARLFDPELTGEPLQNAIRTWIEESLSPSAKLKALAASELGKAQHEVKVHLPAGGGVRTLEPGVASMILKGVVEQWAALRLHTPKVITISEPGDKVYVTDQKTLTAAGLSINQSELLPDALIADLGADPVEFWIVEAVATDGPITEHRKAQLIAWAVPQNIPANQLRFLTAFASRNAAPARKRLKDLAAGTHAWFLDEPFHELAWDEIPVAGLAPVVQLHPGK